MKKTRKTKQNSLLKIILLLLTYIGLLLVFFPIIKDLVFVEKTTHTTITKINQAKEIENIPFDRIDAPTLREIAESSPQNLESIGEIQLPSIDLVTPIFSGLSQQQMIYGAGSMYPKRDPRRNNLVLLGHHVGVSDLLFGKLQQAKVGQKIYLRYLSDYLEYVITEQKTIDETDLAYLAESSSPKLTLITCDKPTLTKKRIAVIAQPIKAAGAASVKTKMNKETKQYKQVQTSLRIKKIVWPIVCLAVLFILVTIGILKKV
ncbi:class A sortase [Enterococcus pallens]|uniref:Sortase n=1 Tax=Enterococcus pallens ATCC BAA-351 TaxID=1158607 RepID=R2SXL7_9ENTE|nr:class A sortase [Enterococcus pallens]EOH97516.1 sortase [Enterococcus pallens ATCC BAA-351]EOU21065.1 hypothetical protein I588_01912 [Enterococcus pallens ATCC BAA-351]